MGGLAHSYTTLILNRLEKLMHRSRKRRQGMRAYADAHLRHRLQQLKRLEHALAAFIGCSHDMCASIGRQAKSAQALHQTIELICRCVGLFCMKRVSASEKPKLSTFRGYMRVMYESKKHAGVSAP